MSEAQRVLDYLLAQNGQWVPRQELGRALRLNARSNGLNTTLMRRQLAAKGYELENRLIPGKGLAAEWRVVGPAVPIQPGSLRPETNFQQTMIATLKTRPNEWIESMEWHRLAGLTKRVSWNNVRRAAARHGLRVEQRRKGMATLVRVTVAEERRAASVLAAAITVQPVIGGHVQVVGLRLREDGTTAVGLMGESDFTALSSNGGLPLAEQVTVVGLTWNPTDNRRTVVLRRPDGSEKEMALA